MEKNSLFSLLSLLDEEQKPLLRLENHFTLFDPTNAYVESDVADIEKAKREQSKSAVTCPR